MKNKKQFFLIFIFLILSTFFCYHINKKNKKGTYLKEFSKKKFYKKINISPLWVYKQIANDFSSTKKITQPSIEKTFEKIKSSSFIQKLAFFRYRIVNNKIYRIYPENEDINFNVLDFEKALVTLSKIIKLPDMDFIYCDLDGLPLNPISEPFYKTNNQAPIFCHAKIKNCENLILIPDHNSLSRNWKNLYFEILKTNDKYLWSEKLNVAFWRGGPNDQTYTQENFIKKPRIIICRLSQSHFDLVDAGITKSWVFQAEDLLKKENLMKDFVSLEKHLEYKFFPVLDGFMCTYPGYQWRLLSNSVCFKQDSNQVQWFYSALRPYEHYVPVENDLSDLIEKINWAKSNDEKCYRMAKNATDFAMDNLTMEDIYVYLFRVLNKYSKYQDFDKNILLKDIKKDKRWVCIQNRKKADKLLKNKASNKIKPN